MLPLADKTAKVVRALITLYLWPTAARHHHTPKGAVVMNLPTYSQAIVLEAREATDRLVDQFKQHALFANDSLSTLPALHKDAGHELIQKMIKGIINAVGANDNDVQMWLIRLANFHGVEDAHVILLEWIRDYHQKGQPLPTYLATYDDVLRDDFVSRTGSPRSKNIAADIAICCLVFNLTQSPYCFHARSRHRHKPSASSIVAEALADAGISRGGADGILNVWKEYGRGLLPSTMLK